MNQKSKTNVINNYLKAYTAYKEVCGIFNIKKISF